MSNLKKVILATAIATTVITNSNPAKAQYAPYPQNQYPQTPQGQYPQSPQNQYPQMPQGQYPQSPQNQYPQSTQGQYSVRGNWVCNSSGMYENTPYQVVTQATYAPNGQYASVTQVAVQGHGTTQISEQGRYQYQNGVIMHQTTSMNPHPTDDFGQPVQFSEPESTQVNFVSASQVVVPDGMGGQYTCNRVSG